MEFAIYKQNDILPARLKSHVTLLEVLPVTSADCEHGISQVNLYHTSGRNRLLTETLSDLRMVGINGPPVSSWNAMKYVLNWLKSRKHGTLDASWGVPKREPIVSKHSLLFA